ncbi:peptidylprolyl isomerase [Gemmatimonas aurantiaca]|uniref:peptidylprolyl isomerase n=1 Tax=Gemmatimonas aurantiaca TaxID=173480 RepID=UPI00301E03C4
MNRSSLYSLLTGVAIVAAPVSLSHAQDTTAAKAAKAAAHDTVRGIPVDGIAAVVGDQVILVSEMMASVNSARAQGAKVENARDLARLETDALQQLIEAELLVQKAKAEKVEINDNDLQSQVDAREKQARANFATESEFRQALKENGFGTIEEWRKMQMDAARRNKLQQDVMQKLQRDGKVTAVNVTEAEINEAYEEAKSQLPRKEARVGMRQIVVATKPTEAAKKKARAKIDSLRAELDKHPEDFENIAKRESMDGTRELGGDLGWNRRGRMVPEFDRMMFALNPGVISPVVETGFGYHIIRVDRVQPAEVKARHILIRPSVDSADEARTRVLADSVANAWRKGGSYDSLSVRFHDEAGGEEKNIPEYPRSELPEAYRNALEGAKLNDIIGPFAIPDPAAGANKFIIAQVTLLDEGGEMTPAEARTRIREHLAGEKKMRRLIDSLKAQTYVSIRYHPDQQGAP